MGGIAEFIGRVKLQMRGAKNVIGWSMTAQEAVSFIKSRGKMVLTFFGYSGMGYEDEEAMLNIAKNLLQHYLPEKTLINIGATSVGCGAVYPLAKSMGFETSGIVTTVALKYPEEISDSVDHICFVKDKQYGGKLPGSNELSPTSRAMVDCSDMLVSIGGGDICRDELLEGKKLGKPIQFFPAEMNHENGIRFANRRGLPAPRSFVGSVHELFED